jgi:hypothetical protein
VGYNVIEHLIKFNKLNDDEIATAFVRINACHATALVNLANSANHDELCVVKTCKKRCKLSYLHNNHKLGQFDYTTLKFRLPPTPTTVKLPPYIYYLKFIKLATR